MGVLYGYKKTLGYLMGIAAGFFIIMMLCVWVSGFLLEKFPAFERVLRIVGALYILWLAWGTLSVSYSFEEKENLPFGFLKGFFLQILNPKVIVYGLTLYATFLADWDYSLFELMLSAVIFAGLAFSSISLWTLFGAAIRKYLDKPKIKRIVNTVLALLLVYSAIELSDILQILR